MTDLGSIATAALVVLNVLTFALFGWDKACAVGNRRRVPERTLLTFMAVGGSPGGWLAMLIFHHKTSKTSFRSIAIAIALLQIIAIFAIVWLTNR
jgi:uncharacterized membrane protein YsdA (DUF1294 family)